MRLREAWPVLDRSPDDQVRSAKASGGKLDREPGGCEEGIGAVRIGGRLRLAEERAVLVAESHERPAEPIGPLDQPPAGHVPGKGEHTVIEARADRHRRARQLDPVGEDVQRAGAADAPDG